VAPDFAAFQAVQRGMTALAALLASALVIILVGRLPRIGPLDRALTVPVAATVTIGVTGALVFQGTLITDGVTLGDVLRVYLFQGICATTVPLALDRKSTRLNSSHVKISYAVF